MTFEEIIFQDATSRNSKRQIRSTFSSLQLPNRPKQCSYYQGCGADICTLFLKDIHRHVFSDKCPAAFDKIREKLQKLESCGHIAKLKFDSDHMGEFDYSGKRKIFFFTDSPIEHINFCREYGRLSVVFEWNPGTSTLEPTFYDSVKR